MNHPSDYKQAPPYPVLIVGHGIAGGLLAYELWQRKVRFVIYDPGATSSSSKVSSGLVNPVTGRYFARSWRIDELLPFAAGRYRDLATATGLEIIRETAICRQLYTVAQENEWVSRMGQERFARYLSLWEGPPPLPLLEAGVSSGKISPVLQINTPALLEGLKRIWENEQCIRDDKLQYELLLENEDHWTYRDEPFSAVIFAEGFHVQQNPYFDWLPIEPTKGEAFLARIEAPATKDILKHHCFVIPWQEDTYWVGSNYEKFPGDLTMNDVEQSKLEERLRRSIRPPFQVLRRLTGVRPASRDRRPILGGHPEKNGLFILNGLGTKGTLFAPFVAKVLADHVLDGKPIDPELDVHRWYDLYRPSA